MKFDEFEKKINQIIFVSATPGPYELEHSTSVVEQVIRPTGIIDPKIEVRPVKGQIDNLIGEINSVVSRGFRVLVTTLTKKMAEDLTDYFKDLGIRVRYLHSDIQTIERMKIIRDLRLGAFDVLVGINLLREGLDIPEVALVAILDADKEGFLRSETSLIQTTGRAARNTESKVIMYADRITDSMKRAIDETNRRRKIQTGYNDTHNIIPKTIVKPVFDVIEATVGTDNKGNLDMENVGRMKKDEIRKMIGRLENEMKDAAKELQFERAAEIRDVIFELKLKHGI